MCTGRCPRCDSYSCHCSDYNLREYQREHQFDSFQPDVLSRWRQDDANERVECELRDRRRREEEREEEERSERLRERHRREEAEAERYREEQYYEQQRQEDEHFRDDKPPEPELPDA